MAATIDTFLAPGQRYVPSGSAGWRADRQVTIVKVDPDLAGLPRVSYLGPMGHEIVEPAAQFEAAVANGHLVPVVGFGDLARA